MASGFRQLGGPTTRVSSGQKRSRGAWSGGTEESDDSDSDGSAHRRSASRPKKRFIWPEELHRDFIAAVFDMGLKKADASRLKELMPKKERSLEPEAMKSCLQKLRSFRYQMRSALGGDNLDTPEELAQKGISSPGVGLGLALSLKQHPNGTFSLPGLAEANSIEMDDLREAFEMPRELASAMEQLDSQQMKRSVELMGQCVQVQRSAHGVLVRAIETQEALHAAIMDKVRQMGLPMPHGHSSNEGPHSSDEGSGRHRDRHASHASTNSVDALGWTDDSHHTHPNVTENGCSSAARAKGSRPTVLVRVQGKSSANSSSAFDESRASVGRNPALVALAGSSSAPASESAGTPGAGGGDGATGSQASGEDILAGGADGRNTAGGDEGGVSALLPGGAASDEVKWPGGPARSPAVGEDQGPSPPPAPPPPPLVSAPHSMASAASTASPNSAVAASLDHVPREADLLFSGQEDQDDEISMRMAMKTGMDMHRLMRSRQKNQLQLHRPEKQQKQQQQQPRARKEARHAGVVPMGSASLLPPPPPKRSSGKASSSSLYPSSLAAAASAGVLSTPSSITNALLNAQPAPPASPGSPSAAAASSSSSVSAGGEGPLPMPSTSPPPFSGDGQASASGSASGSNVVGGGGAGGAVGGTDILDAPASLAVDWNWDEDALDSQLFSFLLDSEEP